MVFLTNYCRDVLLQWKRITGPTFSEFVFANPQNPSMQIKDYKRQWRTVAKKADRRSSLVRYALDVRLTCESICPFDFDSLWSCGGPWRGSIIRATVKLLSPASTASPGTNRWKLGYDLVERQGADTLRNAELGLSFGTNAVSPLVG
jgi:hypothetical protein